MAKILSNITVKVNNANIRKETRDGREYIIVKAKTLPDNIVMNGILYPGDEVQKSFKTLEKTPAPFGHPKVNGKHVSATDPYGINIGWIGAFNENVTYENGRVTMDKVIDVLVANQSENGRSVLAAIEKQEPIHTSTGVFIETDDTPEPVTNALGKTYTRIAKNMMFDHDCFLLNESGAATPGEGVGIFVNSEIDVVNNMNDDSYDEEIQWAAKRLADAIQAKENASKSGGILAKIMSLFSGGVSVEASGLNTNHVNEGNEMTVSQEKFDALAKKVDDLTTNAANIAETVQAAITAALAPLNTTITELQTNSRKAEEDERAGLVVKLIANGAIAEGEDKEFTTNALRIMAGKIKAAGPAAPIVGGFNLNAADDKGLNDYDPNVAILAAMNAGAK